MSDYQSLYIQKQLIGRGQFGRVHLIYDRISLQPYVCKKIQLQGLNQQQKVSTLKQIQIHKKLKHKNILQFKQYFLENDMLIMIMDYCQFGDLSLYIKSRKEKCQLFDQPLIINLFVQMLFGLNYLHQNKIIHRDLKPQNIFIDSQGIIKLADFGISKMLDTTQQLSSTVIGTPFYLSPQACSNLGYSYKSDIWSLGCVLYQLCALQKPFQGDNILLLAKRITTEQPKIIPSKYSQNLKNLIKLLLRKKTQQRPSIQNILDQQFIKQYIIQFKMQDQHHKCQGNNYSNVSTNQSSSYPIYQTQTNLQKQLLDNQFIDLQDYQHQKYNSHSHVHIQSSPKINKKHQQIKISPNKSASQSLRLRCISKMGQELFYEMYQLMRNMSQSKKQTQVQSIMKKRYSKKQYQLSMDIAQLIYLEDNQKN